METVANALPKVGGISNIVAGIDATIAPPNAPVEVVPPMVAPPPPTQQQPPITSKPGQQASPPRPQQQPPAPPPQKKGLFGGLVEKASQPKAAPKPYIRQKKAKRRAGEVGKGGVKGLVTTLGLTIMGSVILWVNGMFIVKAVCAIFHLNPNNMGLWGYALWLIPALISFLEHQYMPEWLDIAWWVVLFREHKMEFSIWAFFTALDLFVTSQGVTPWLFSLDLKQIGLPNFASLGGATATAVVFAVTLIVALAPEPMIERFGAELVHIAREF